MPYKVIGMLHNGGLMKDTNSGVAIVYFNAQERAKYEIVANNGFLCSVRGGVLDTGTSSNKAFIFVMTAEGKIYSGDKSQVKHHSAFMSGRPVAAAGTWTVENGVPVNISGESGHYQPTSDYLKQFISELKSRNVNLKKAAIKYGKSSKEIGRLMLARGMKQNMRLYTPERPRHEWF